MIVQILSNTPLWVWALLLALVWLGASQAVWRVVSLGRVLRVAIALTCFSLYGVLSSFGGSAAALAAWLGSALLAAWMTLRLPLAEGTRYLARQRAFEVPGSLAPLGLMLGVFALKYAVGVMMGMHAAPTVHPLFAPAVGLIYGGFSGVFIGRAARLLGLARRTSMLGMAP